MQLVNSYGFWVAMVLIIALFAIYCSMQLAKLFKIIRQSRIMTNENAEPSTDILKTFTQVSNELEALMNERKAEIDRLEKLESYRKEYLGNVSHELKTPIFNIQGYVSTLLDGGLEDETINRDFLKRAEQSVERMISIVDDLQVISQLEAGELHLELERFDLTAMIKDVFKGQEMRASERNISLSIKNPDEKPVFVYADKFRIRQVITNLIVNSIKYGKKDGETKVKLYDMGDTVMCEVSDNGIGIEAKHLPRLFERFYRVDKHRSREAGGTGLGLAIVKHILEAHNQKINVMSTEGVGSVFTFALSKAEEAVAKN